MFSDTFNQIAKRVGINTDDLVTRIGSIDERYKDSDKSDIEVVSDWLNVISEEISVKEVAFLLMAALRPEVALEDYQEDDSNEQFFEMLREQGFTQLADGSWVKIVEEENADKEVNNIKDKIEQKTIGYTPAVEQTRNALGYDHSQNSLFNAIGLDDRLLNDKIDYIVNSISTPVSTSKSIEMFEREFTRKELAYMYTYKAKKYDELLESSKKEINELKNKEITITKSKRKTITKKKKDDESI